MITLFWDMMPHHLLETY